MADLARLVVSLEAQTAKYQKELDKANRKLDRFGRDQKRLLDKVSGGFRTLSRAAGIAFAALGASSLGGFIRQTALAAENLELISLRLGVSAKELQAWQLIAERANVSQSQFNMGLQRLIRRSGEAAKGMGEAKDALKQLGIDAATFNNLNLDQRILTLADAFEEVEGDAEKLRIAFKLFDSEGTAWLQFLKEGRDALERLREQVGGQVWSDEQRKKLADANRLLTITGQELKLSLTPAIVSAAEATKSLVNEFSRLSKIKLNIGPTTSFFDILTQLFRGKDVQGGPVIRGGGGVLDENGFPILDKSSQNQSKRKVDLAGVSRAIANARSFEETSALKPDLKRRKVDDAAIDQLKEYEQEFNDALIAQQRAYADYNDRLLRLDKEKFEKQKELNERAKENFTDLFADNMVQAAEFGFKSILKSWAQTLQQMVAKAAASKIFDLISGGSGGGFLSKIGSILTGARAFGGPVMAGGAYLVGERGPEIFTPRSSGTIIPNAGQSNVFNIDARGATPGVELRIKQAVSEAVALSRQERIESQRRGRA